ncbi:MAG: CsgG/HfaB family protein, partial [Phycisphaerae bacterium]
MPERSQKIIRSKLKRRKPCPSAEQRAAESEIEIMRRVLTLVLLATRVLSSAMADETAQSRPPLAVFPFEERGSGTEGTGRKISDFLTATLATDPELVVVERAELNKLLEEQKLSVSGLVKPDEAVQVGRLTG